MWANLDTVFQLHLHHGQEKRLVISLNLLTPLLLSKSQCTDCLVFTEKVLLSQMQIVVQYSPQVVFFSRTATHLALHYTMGSL